MTQYQNYKKYKLPITLNPLEYGKLIIKLDSLKLFIIQINRTNVILLYHFNNYNYIKLFKKGDFMFEYKDYITSDNEFVRKLNEFEFTFKNKILTSIKSITRKIINSTTLLKILTTI